ncbi:MAG: diguanylate cyclase [Solirubrobacterales bacterium]
MSAHPRDRTRRLEAPDLVDSRPLTSNQAAHEADQTSSDADETSASADAVATNRDLAASDRETASTARDSAAADRDRAAEEQEHARGPGGPEYEAAVKHAASVRALAATDREMAAADRNQASIDRAEATLDRERAASDREHAAMDREHAAMDRRQAVSELERAHTDDLTGAYRRGAGETILQGELDRASRSGSGLVLAFVDVNGLKVTNDRDGHAAGDARLRDVVNAMRSKIRSYEPIVRYGGDEFVCSFAGVDVRGVQTRFDEIEALIDARGEGCSMSVGLATYRAEDTLGSLIERADAALIKGRTEAGRGSGVSAHALHG